MALKSAGPLFEFVLTVKVMSLSLEDVDYFDFLNEQSENVSPRAEHNRAYQILYEKDQTICECTCRVAIV